MGARHLSIKQCRDVIETDIMHFNELGVPLDLNGWDICKALQLAIKSNPVLFEWIQSPIKYFSNDLIVNDLMKFAQKTANLDYIKTHYFKLMCNVYEQIKKDNEVKLKLYCYALRPALSLQWIKQFGIIPPMDMSTLCVSLGSYISIEREISELVRLKKKSNEKDIIARNQKIDSFIESMLSEPIIKFKKPATEEKYQEANIFFRNIISSYSKICLH